MHSLLGLHSVTLFYNVPHYLEAIPAKMFIIIHDIFRQQVAAVHYKGLLNFAFHTIHDESPTQLM